MFCRRSLEFCCKLISNKRSFHRSVKLNNEFENPIWRTFRILRDDVFLRNRIFANDRITTISREFPRQADIVIIGGGAIGSSIAYWLKEKTSYKGLRVVVIEKDATVKIINSI